MLIISSACGDLSRIAGDDDCDGQRVLAYKEREFRGYLKCGILAYGFARSSASSRQATSAAESACMAAVNRNYGGNVKSLRVVHSEFSQANSEVRLEAVGAQPGSKTDHWRCLSSNDGHVEDLSIVH